MPNKILWISFVALLSLISSCASVPDVPVCTEISMQKGFCVYTLSDKEMIVDNENTLDGKTWWDMRTSMILVPVDSWAEIKSYIIKMCKKHGSCDKEVANWNKKVDSLDSKLGSKK